MFTSLDEMIKNAKNRTIKAECDKLGRELAADIVKEVKTLNPSQIEYRRELNKDRIKALGLILIQGGKS